MTCFTLYLFLAGQSPIQVHQCFPDIQSCEAAGKAEVTRWHLGHHIASGFFWCVKDKGW